MQPGSLGTQDSEGWVRAEGLSVFRLETPRTGKGREDVQCSTYFAILTPRIISWSQAACRSDMETWTFWAPQSVWDSFISWKWCKKSWSLFFPCTVPSGCDMEADLVLVFLSTKNSSSQGRICAPGWVREIGWQVEDERSHPKSAVIFHVSPNYPLMALFGPLSLWQPIRANLWRHNFHTLTRELCPTTPVPAPVFSMAPV